jgi:hypothetical protein
VATVLSHPKKISIWPTRTPAGLAGFGSSAMTPVAQVSWFSVNWNREGKA